MLVLMVPQLNVQVVLHNYNNNWKLHAIAVSRLQLKRLKDTCGFNEHVGMYIVCGTCCHLMYTLQHIVV